MRELMFSKVSIEGENMVTDILSGVYPVTTIILNNINFVPSSLVESKGMEETSIIIPFS